MKVLALALLLTLSAGLVAGCLLVEDRRDAGVASDAGGRD